MKSTLRVGLLGCGFMGKTHAEAWRKVAAAKIVAVAGIPLSAARELAATCGADATDSLPAVVARADVDAIDICLPTPLHEEFAVAALKAGKHVLCEKPLATSLDAADRILTAARAAGKTFMVAQVVRFWPPYKAARDVCVGGAIGKVLAINASRASAPPDWAGWFADPQQTGGALYVKFKHPGRDTGWGIWQINFSNPQIGTTTGQVLDELPYLTHVRLADKPDMVDAKLNLSLPGFPLGEDDTLASITARTLAGTPVTRDKQPGQFQIAMALDESILLAARKAGKYLVGWPKHQANQDALIRTVQQQIAIMAGYYQEQNVLGVLSSQTPGEVLALVRLRHKVPQNADPMSGEFDAQGRKREFFCVAVYRFQQDAKTAKLSPLGRGVFFHGPTDPRKPTPEVEITSALWPVVRKGNQVTVVTAQP